jgi:hypothetical protein
MPRSHRSGPDRTSPPAAGARREAPTGGPWAPVGNRALVRVLRPVANAGPAVQRVTVEQYNSVKPPTDLVAELDSILTAAEKQKGEERRGEMLGRLEDLAKSASGPSSSRSTYGLSGASYFPGVESVFVEGPPKFMSAMSAVAPEAVSIGARETGVHDEMAHISAHPGVQAVHSTQRNCIFCYGVLERRGYQHGPLRASPWPDMWTHDYLKYTIHRMVDYLALKSAYPVLEIVTKDWGSRLYRVEKLT